MENVDVKLGINNILIGQNNVGKSNFLKAIDIAFNGSKTLTEDDIFVEKDERLSKDKKATIDIKIVPSNNNKEFSGSSFNDIELKKDRTLELDYIVATPRMKFYMEYSTKMI